ncbi:MAG: acyl-CoA dehydrogenase [Actinomycetia bacterium]|nr:acyl-CoA dehydrogenase [Actinomycetes bacterium]
MAEPAVPPNPPTDPEIADQLIDTLRDWVKRDVIPHVADYEHDDLYPTPMVDQMANFGLFGSTIPTQYGGLGLDLRTYARVVEELSYGWMSLSGVINSHLIAATLILRHGSEEQKQRWLPDLASATRRGCFSLSEPDSGSDAAALRCKADPDGDIYRISGTKMWVTNGERAAIVALLARTPEGITCFIVEKEPGQGSGSLTVSRRIHKLGYRGLETVEMAYDDHEVPANCVLGGEAGLGQGFAYALGALEVGRVNVASRGVGVARAAFDDALAYAQQRETFGKPIAKHQAIQFKLADMATRLEASRLLVKQAAEKYDAGERIDLEAGMAKLFATEAAQDNALDAMRIHGGYGYTTEFAVERYYRDTPLLIIGEGTSEIQRMVIGRRLVEEYGGK